MSDASHIPVRSMVRSLFLTATACLVASCASPPNLVVYQEETEWVVLREPSAGHADLQPHNHPYTISGEKLKGHLAALSYRESSLFSFIWQKPRRVFTDRQAELLSRQLSQAFDQALPQEVVAFRAVDHELPARYTQGSCFVAAGHLHVVLDAVRRLDYEKSDQVSPPLKHPRWELYPRAGQRLFASRPGGKGTVNNWIIVDLDSTSE